MIRAPGARAKNWALNFPHFWKLLSLKLPFNILIFYKGNDAVLASLWHNPLHDLLKHWHSSQAKRRQSSMQIHPAVEAKNAKFLLSIWPLWLTKGLSSFFQKIIFPTDSSDAGCNDADCPSICFHKSQVHLSSLSLKHQHNQLQYTMPVTYTIEHAKSGRAGCSK